MPPIPSLMAFVTDMQRWRHDFHQNPELGYDVHETAGKVAALLRGFGCDQVIEGIARTGVVGVISGQKNSTGRVIGLRADMDALPIHEKTGLDYASGVAGKMHACGHDGHTSMLLGAAWHLCKNRDFDGTVVLAFQPAEEGGAGARAMVDEGLISRFEIDEIYAMHNMPGLEVGHFAIRPGPIMAAADEFEIIITGKGGHAAQPHRCIDAVLVAAQVVTALQSIVSRTISVMDQAVVSVSSISSDSPAHNVLPQNVVMSGTVRTMRAATQAVIEQRLAEISQSVAHAFGATAELRYHRGYPVTVNAAEQTGYAIAAAQKVGHKTLADIEPQMWSEDFSFMLEACPGAYIYTGNGDSAALHHPSYNFDDKALPYGSSWFVEMVQTRLPLTA